MADQSQQVPPPAASSQSPSGPRAGFGVRLGAALIDGILTSAVVQVIGLAFGQDFLLLDTTGSKLEFRFGATGLSTIIFLGIPMLYYSYLEGGDSGQTIGKKLLNIRVVDFSSGGPIGFGRGLLRWVGRFASAAVCLLGYLWMLWDPEKQTWHDKIATTVVVPSR